MLHTLSVSSDNHTPFNLPQFLKYLDIPITQEFEGTEGNATFYYLQRPDHSTTFFLLVDCGEGTYEIGMDGMASFADYKFLRDGNIQILEKLWEVERSMIIGRDRQGM